jgi:hypothetical protein
MKNDEYHNRRKERVVQIDRNCKRIASAGIVTIALSAPLAIGGFVDTTIRESDQQNLEAMERTKDSFEAYQIVRSPLMNYSWGAILAGNLICASSVLYKIRALKKIGIDRFISSPESYDIYIKGGENEK